MAYYVEYIIGQPEDDDHYEIPVNDKEPGYTIPLSETDAEVVDVEQLSARSGVFGANLAEAQLAAEEIIGHSKSTQAALYQDEPNSTERGGRNAAGHIPPGTRLGGCPSLRFMAARFACPPRGTRTARL
ncbi:hypothetical protein [Arthrobacter castelli]|uniref:hypothetical protein n=1 Tax=Arthrobacter castelli TaxID=271431 RepID=UPI000425CA0E|nr:hypothetical protein [Arthrobacter castelli]